MSIEDKSNVRINGSGRLVATPNPFSTSVKIRVLIANYELQVTNNYDVGIYDIRGKVIYSKIVNRNSSLVWDALNHPGGVYIVRMTSGNEVQTARILLLK